MKIRYRWYGPEDKAPMHGCYLLSQHRPRIGYLILSVIENEGPRGGLGSPIFTLLRLEVDRVPVAEARASDLCYPIKWDARGRKRGPEFVPP